MTTIVDKVQLLPLEKTIRELQTPLFLINGKLERIDWSQDLRHVFRFIEIISDLAKKSIPENIFAETFIQFQYLSDLLLESHSGDNSFNNDDMIAYFLALLDITLAHYGRELEQKLFFRILRFWGVDQDIGTYSKKVTQAKNILENAQLVYTDCEKIIDEILTRVSLLTKYLKEILPQANEELDLMLEEITDLTRKKVVPYANVSNSALTMIVAFFPFYLNYPAVKLFVMLHLKEDLKVPLPSLRKDVFRYRKRLQKVGILKK
jgi:hypothetical protein